VLKWSVRPLTFIDSPFSPSVIHSFTPSLTCSTKSSHTNGIYAAASRGTACLHQLVYSSHRTFCANHYLFFITFCYSSVLYVKLLWYLMHFITVSCYVLRCCQCPLKRLYSLVTFFHIQFKTKEKSFTVTVEGFCVTVIFLNNLAHFLS